MFESLIVLFDEFSGADNTGIGKIPRAIGNQVEYYKPKHDTHKRYIVIRNCAQIVPVKVKYFQTFPNETKSWLKKCYRIN